MNTLPLPLWLALGGIVLRGAGFAFREEITRLGQQRAAGATFAFFSLLTPFFMGTVVGAIAAGAVPAGANRASMAAWTSPTALLAGFLFVAACGYLAAVYLIVEAQRRGDPAMQAYFTRRAQAAALLAGALSLWALFELRNPNPALFDRLTGRALPLVVLAGVCGLTVLALLTAGRAKGARVVAALGVAAVIWGWGVAQYPVLLPGTTVTLTAPTPRMPRSSHWSSWPPPPSSSSSPPSPCCSPCRAAVCSAGPPHPKAPVWMRAGRRCGLASRLRGGGEYRACHTGAVRGS